MPESLTAQPKTDPTPIYRYRDGLYAEDMLVAALVWLDLFSWLDRNPCDLDALCAGLQLQRLPADVMMTLFVAMGLVQREDGRYCVSEVTREHLVKTSPWFLGPYYASLKDRPVAKDLVQVLRSGKPANWGSDKDKADWHKAMETEEFAAQFTAAMDCRGVFLAQAAAKRLDLRERRRLLDIAGGSGIYACSFCAHFPHLRATVLEKPPVDRITREAIAKRNFSSLVDVCASDMLQAPFPAGYDAHLFSNVLHDWDVPVVKHLIAKSFAALEPGGVVAIHDAHLDENKSGPLHVAEYSVMLMHSTEGRCYSVREIREILEHAGFQAVNYTPTAAARSVITATKPA